MDVKEKIPKPKTKFLRVKCISCGNEQNVFSAPASKIKCIVCDKELAECTGSKINLKSKVVKVNE